MRWPVLWPFLFGALGYYCRGRRIDMARVMAALGRGEPVARLPYGKRLTWAPQGQLILDMADRLLPFWDDISTR